MQTECSRDQLEFQVFGGRRVEAAFDGGHQSSDAGVLLLREVAERTGLIGRFASCFSDHRRPERIEHTVEQLLGQRVFGQALGYEDLNDHDRLRASSSTTSPRTRPRPSRTGWLDVRASMSTSSPRTRPG